MKKSLLLSAVCFLSLSLFAGTLVKTYHFGKALVKSNGNYQTISFANTLLSGNGGEPMMPWASVSLLLPPGESATSIHMQGSGFVELEGKILIQPQQDISPISKGDNGRFLKNEPVYASSSAYPLVNTGKITTSFMNGYAFALCTFTPLLYYPSLQKAGYYSEVTITITTAKSAKASEALKNLSPSEKVIARVRQFAQNPASLELYPPAKSGATDYQMLIITGQSFASGFAALTHMYDSLGVSSQIFTVEDIYANITGVNNPEKVRNFIQQEYQQNHIEYVLLGGDVSVVPYRGFYCSAFSGGQYYTDPDIPADLYYSGMDGNYDANNNGIYAELADDPDLLPEVSVGRMPFENATEQSNIIHKTIWYRCHQIPGEQTQPLLAAEFMDQATMTFGQDYIDLLVEDHTDNGYYTHGIPSTDNIDRLYDTIVNPLGGVIYYWDPADLYNRISQGPSFIYHCGHANADYVMKLNKQDITNSHFSAIDGVTHDYTLLYTHGCDCGAFDNNDCIAEKMVLIQNFLAGGIFNSRYGWFDQGTTEGPSAHMNREFVSALYNDTIADQIHEMGSAHLMSKVKSAPWVTLPDSLQFEPGAQRWCHYDCNLLGDPSLWVFTKDIAVGINDMKTKNTLTAYPNPCDGKVTLTSGSALSAKARISLYNTWGQVVRTWENMMLSDPKNITLNLPSVTPGVYTLEIESTDLKERLKLIVR
ncbi:MAG: C25 family cysteine peptidase [Bacteroidota bacterium]|jgi:Peptidase family C25/Propeptide_C25/Secretion system C-terminal sorting domain